MALEPPQLRRTTRTYLCQSLLGILTINELPQEKDPNGESGRKAVIIVVANPVTSSYYSEIQVYRDIHTLITIGDCRCCGQFARMINVLPHKDLTFTSPLRQRIKPKHFVAYRNELFRHPVHGCQNMDHSQPSASSVFYQERRRVRQHK